MAVTSHVRQRLLVVPLVLISIADIAQVIVPNDQALADQDLSSLDNDTLTALLQYHAVQGIYPVSTFSTTPVFIPTLLNNPNFTNVTGGQRAELILQNGTAAFLTGLKSPSKVIQAVRPARLNA